MLDASYRVAVLGIVGDIAVFVGGEIDVAVGAVINAYYAAAPEVARSLYR